MEVMDWDGNSPDLSPAENLCRVLKFCETTKKSKGFM